MTVVLGALGANGTAVVDAAGTVTADGLTVQWLVGAEDRWHVAAEEAAVRQSAASSVGVETRMRVPGGDIVQTIWVAALGGEGCAVLEFTNDTPVPVVLALRVRQPAGPAGAPDPMARLRPGRPPSPEGSAPVPGPALPGETVMVWPLPHRTSLSVTVALAATSTVAPSPAELPGLADVARGWERHLAEGVRAYLPEPGLDDAVARARQVLLVAGSGADAGAALAAWGHPDAAVACWGGNVALPGPADDEGPSVLAPAVLSAFASHGTRPPGWDGAVLADAVAASLPAVAGVPARRLRRRPAVAGDRRAVIAAGHLLARLGDGAAAADLWDLADGIDAGPTVTVEDVVALAEAPSDPDTAVALLLALRRLLVEDLVSPGPKVVVTMLATILAGPSPRWVGQGVEVHDLPTAAGRLSFAVRWHGERPALLWDLEDPWPGVVLRCGLDPAWSTTDARGETLLAALPAAMVARDDAPVSAAVRRGIVVVADDDAGSFS